MIVNKFCYFVQTLGQMNRAMTKILSYTGMIIIRLRNLFGRNLVHNGELHPATKTKIING